MPGNRKQPVAKNFDKIQLNYPDGFHSTETTKPAVCRAEHFLNTQNKEKTIHKWKVQMLSQLYFCSSRNATQSIQSYSSRAPIFLLLGVLCNCKCHQIECTQFLVLPCISPHATTEGGIAFLPHSSQSQASPTGLQEAKQHLLNKQRTADDSASSQI